MKRKTVKTRIILGGGGFGSSVKSPEWQKISVQCEKLKIKSSKRAKKHASCRTRFGMTLNCTGDMVFNSYAKNKINERKLFIQLKLIKKGAKIMNLKPAKESRQIFALQRLMNSGVLSLDAPQGLVPQGLIQKEFAPHWLATNLKPAKAFSVAEAMIALLIGTLVLGFSAPMISKQLKHNDFTSIQTQILNKKIENVDDKSDANAGKISGILDGKDVAAYVDYIKSLEDKIADIEAITNNTNIQNIINGTSQQKNYDSDISSLTTQLSLKASSSTVSSLQTTVRTIDSDLTALETDVTELEDDIKKLVPSGAVMYFDLASCPSGWTALSSKYPKAANAFIRNQSGSGRNIGNWQQNAAPNVEGSFYALDQIDSYTGAFYRAGSRTGGWGGAGQYTYRQQYLDMSRYSSVYKDDVTEIRPDNIVLLACRKN